MLFEEKERVDQDSKRYIENDFTYLDRSARKESDNVRQFLNKWVNCFPKQEAIEIISRIKSGDKIAFDSAVFEVFLYSIIKSLGYHIDIHPELDNGSKKRPDFLVRTPNGDEFYLEAVLASEDSKEKKAKEQIKNVVLEAINSINSPDFFIGINAEGDPNTPPSSKKLCSFITLWLTQLDPDIVMENVEKNGLDSIPSIIWKHEGWCIEFEAIPKNPEKRGKGQKVIGLHSNGFREVNTWKTIIKAIRSKGGRYGELKKPFIIAICVDEFSIDRYDETQALFGQEELIINIETLTILPKKRRARNGAWLGPQGIQYTRVSGVWIFNSVNPWNLVTRQNTLYFNPWAQFSIPDELQTVNHAIVVGSKLEWIEGKNLSDILDLPISWPE
ncbi:hypothetical protein D3C80_1158080 [compost metagenome]